MKKIVCIAVAILLGVAPLYASQVNTISMTHQPNTVVVTIYIEGQVRVTHQTEIPKEGRGHRVIIDLLAATHNLGATKFDQLPNCMIKSIRSSQFAVSPEQITRVVFDVDRAPLYRIETDQSSVTIYFTDKGVKQFAAWNSKKALPKRKAKKPAQKLASMKPETKPANTTVASTKPKTKPTTTIVAGTKLKTATPLAEVAVAKTKTAKKPKPSYQPRTVRQNNNNDGDMFAMSQRVANNPLLKGNSWVDRQAKAKKNDSPVKVSAVLAKVETNDQAKKESKKVSPPVKLITPDKPATMLASVSKPKTKAKTKKSSERRPVVLVADTKTKAPDTALMVESPSHMPLKSEMKPAEQTKGQPVKAQGQSALADKIAGDKAKKTITVAQAKPKPKKSSTSRFRRNPGQAGIKGTMVVEFPKRLVIKYKGGKYKDPFETLINANRTTNSPIEKRVPNIDGLRLVGVIESDAKKDRALFEDTDGFGYILKSGDKVRNGYVLRVETDKVYFQIFEYGWSRTVALQLEY